MSTPKLFIFLLLGISGYLIALHTPVWVGITLSIIMTIVVLLMVYRRCFDANSLVGAITTGTPIQRDAGAFAGLGYPIGVLLAYIVRFPELFEMLFLP